MATATKKDRRGMRLARADGAVPGATAVAFLIYEDNGGDFRWTLLGSRGESLAHSVPYATRDAAEQAAGVVRNAAGTARFEPRPADRPDPADRRGVTILPDDSDAERWLDEGGSFSSEAVAKWPASH